MVVPPVVPPVVPVEGVPVDVGAAAATLNVTLSIAVAPALLVSVTLKLYVPWLGGVNVPLMAPLASGPLDVTVTADPAV